MTRIPLNIEENGRVARMMAREELVELTAYVAIENHRSRFNAALGLSAQGFKDRCEIPTASA
jgi:hypothetical protein